MGNGYCGGRAGGSPGHRQVRACYYFGEIDARAEQCREERSTVDLGDCRGPAFGRPARADDGPTVTAMPDAASRGQVN